MGLQKPLKIIVNVMLFGLPTIAVVLRSKTAALVIPTEHIDGAYQTFSGLLRLNEGQIPGRDFFPYLGVGPLFLLYPIFQMSGATVGSSVLTSHLAVVVCLQFAFIVLGFLVATRFSLIKAFALALCPILFLGLIGESWNDPLGFFNIVEIARFSTPGNSLRPIRAFAPYLLAALAVAVFQFGATRRNQIVLLGLGAGVIGAIWSNDYALLSSILFIGLFSLKTLIGRDKWRGLPRVEVTSEMACPEGRPERMTPCPSPIRQSSAMMS